MVFVNVALVIFQIFQLWVFFTIFFFFPPETIAGKIKSEEDRSDHLLPTVFPYPCNTHLKLCQSNTAGISF